MMRSILVQGVETSFEEYGAKHLQPFVFIHGYPGRPQDFRWLVPLLGNYRLIILALPGMDITPLPDREMHTVSSRACFVIDFIKQLQLNGCVLIAHSMGSVIAAHIAAENPKLVASMVFISAVGPKPYRAFRRSRPDWGHHLFTKTPLKMIGAPMVRFLFGFFGFPKGVRTEAMFYVLACGAHLSFPMHHQNLCALQQPVLSIWCHDDPLMEPETFHELYQAITHCEEYSFERGGHSPQKKHATKVAQLIANFLENTNRR